MNKFSDYDQYFRNHEDAHVYFYSLPDWEWDIVRCDIDELVLGGFTPDEICIVAWMDGPIATLRVLVEELQSTPEPESRHAPGT